MASRTFDAKFPFSTQLTFGSLIFAAGENGELKMMSLGLAPGHLAPTSSSASGRSCAGPGRCAGSYIRTAKIIRVIPDVTSTLRPLVGASGSSTSVLTPDSDSTDDYPEIGASACGELTQDGHFIYMVALNGDRTSNTSSRYLTIGRSDASDARTPSGGLAPNCSPLAVLAQQGAEAANLIIAEKSTDVPRRKTSVSGNDRARRS
jgi:hypothetical protein